MNSTVIIALVGELEQLLELEIKTVLSITEDLTESVTYEAVLSLDKTVTFKCNINGERHCAGELENNEVGFLPFLLETALEAGAGDRSAGPGTLPGAPGRPLHLPLVNPLPQLLLHPVLLVQPL